MKKVLSLLLMALFGAGISEAKVTLPSFFSDNMVFQQNERVAIWGWTDTGRKVTVSATWSDEKATAAPGADGKWMVRLQTPAAGGPYEVTVSDGEKTVLHNVLVGEVWYCSGQSNMTMQVKGFAGQPVVGSADAILSAKPEVPIRMCTVERTASLKQLKHTRGSWKENTPEAVAGTSAAAYFFARRLQETLGIPVGILISNWGGSTIEAWIDEPTIRGKFDGEFDLDFLSGTKLPEKQHQTPCTLFNGQVHPLIPFTFKGIIWYQGEANRKRPDQYIRLQKEYVAMMRNLFENPEAPFYFVQIAPYRYDDPDSFDLGFFCEAQRKSLDVIPRSGMAPTLDIGAFGTVHPSHKIEVGDRLAYLALVNDYGVKGIDPFSPTYKSVEFKDGKAVVTMEVGPLGLAPIGENLTGFELAGEDRVFHPAIGRAKGNTVTVSSPEVPNPVALRYGFRNWAVGTLFNNFGVPAGPFRTDDWKE